MDSDTDSVSDSGGSHISATPPRDPPQSLRRPPPSTPLSSSKSTAKTLTPISKPKPPSPTHLKPSKPKPYTNHLKPSKPIIHQPSIQSPNSSPFSDLPFRIRRLSDQDDVPAATAEHSCDTLPAGFFPKSAFFSKLKRSCPLPDSIQDDPIAASGPMPQSPIRDGGGTGHPAASVDTGPNCNRVSAKVARKYPNLIGGCSIAPMPEKRRKCGNEGNFVKLNLNRKKFLNRRGGKTCNSYGGGRKTYRKFKRKVKGGAGGDDSSLLDEDGLVLEEIPHLQEQERAEFQDESMEKAVLAVQNEASDENLAKLLKLTHGYDGFREGQLEAIKLILSGKSTMLVLPTGAGKSLCYQLPAIVFPGITLVVSPLVALMIDQLKQLPPVVHGGLLSSSQTVEEVAETLRLVREGSIKVLFVSPERFLNAAFLSLFSSTLHISLLVVDEAHCISEWSHNFRPAYMRLRASLLHASLNVQCFLGMTATATNKTLHTVMSALEIPTTNLIHRGYLRDNLQLSISRSENRMKDLLLLIKSSTYCELQSIIIYCKFQSETDSISKYLRDNNIPAKGYHGGISAKDRKRTQELFCSNKIRVVVATVAFGMGLDKSDVGAVIHYSLPQSLEEYVQEIGRAGRDGRLSYCHLLFDESIYFKLRSLLHSDGVDEYAVSKFISEVFSDGMDLRGKIRSLVIEPASRKFDMKEEVMLTLLTRLELGEVQYVRTLPQLNVTCTLNFHKTPPGLLAEKDIVFSAILKESEIKQGRYVFDIPSVANRVRSTATGLINQLQNFKSKGEISYELKDPAHCYMIVDVPVDLCALATHLAKWLSEIEACQVLKFDTMLNAAAYSVGECKRQHGCQGSQHTACLQRKIKDYFDGDGYGNIPSKMAQTSRFLRADIKVFLQSNSQAKFTPRAVARIMHGISSPAYPSRTWSICHFWGRYINVDFRVVMEAAREELMKNVGKDRI